MSFVTTQPEALAAAAGGLQGIGSALSAQSAAAAAPSLETRVLVQAFRRRWLLALLCGTFCGGVAAFGTWTLAGQFLSCGFHAPTNRSSMALRSASPPPFRCSTSMKE